MKIILFGEENRTLEMLEERGKGCRVGCQSAFGFTRPVGEFFVVVELGEVVGVELGLEVAEFEDLHQDIGGSVQQDGGKERVGSLS